MQWGSCHGNIGKAPNLNTKSKKMVESRFALSNQSIVEPTARAILTTFKTSLVLLKCTRIYKIYYTNFFVVVDKTEDSNWFLGRGTDPQS